MAAECFRHQVDAIRGNGNAAAYRFGGDNQKASSHEDSLFQHVFQSFRDAFISCQKKDLHLRSEVQFTSHNSREDFRFFEEHYGKAME